MKSAGGGAPIESVRVDTFSIPTDTPEADGTFAWNATTLVVAEVSAASRTGLGYTYSAPAAGAVIEDNLAPLLIGENCFAIPALWTAMVRSVRNFGWRGICAAAISAVDVALWDLKARLLGIPLTALFGQARDEVPVYGSGGFTTYDEARLCDQLAEFVDELGCRLVKMKIGREHVDDPRPVAAAAEAVGDAKLMIDANGALDRKQALHVAEQAAAHGVVWFEEPVSSDDLEGLRLLRDRAPAPIDIAAGEYGCEPFYFRRMLDAGAVDVLQADATRCCGYTGFMAAAALSASHNIPLSAHTAPSLHLPVCCALDGVRHIEWFFDHARIERMLFDGAPAPARGMLAPDLSRTGHGLNLKKADARRYAA